MNCPHHPQPIHTHKKKKEVRSIEKEDKKRTLTAIGNEKKEFVLTSKGVRPQACVFQLSCVGSLSMYMYMKSYKNTKTSSVSCPWCLPHWSFHRLYRGSVLLRCGEVACK